MLHEDFRGPAVPFTERMCLVEMSKHPHCCPTELSTGELCPLSVSNEAVNITQLTVNFASMYIPELHHVAGSVLPCPLVDILEQIAVDGPYVGRIVFVRHN